MDFSNARINMVQQQLRPWHVSSKKILSLMASVPRENFVPKEYRNLAYADTEIPLPNNQHMLAPIIVGRILQAIDFTGMENVLEIGTGSGYLTALLARLSATVTSFELYREISDQAKANLNSCEIKNVTLEVSNGLDKIKRDNYFDVVILTGSVAALPASICQQVADNGKVFAAVGKKPVMVATVYTKIKTDDWAQQKLFETVIPPLEVPPQ